MIGLLSSVLLLIGTVRGIFFYESEHRLGRIPKDEIGIFRTGEFSVVVFSILWLIGLTPFSLGYYAIYSLFSIVSYIASAWTVVIPLVLLFGTVRAIFVLESTYQFPIPSQEIDLFNGVRYTQWATIVISAAWLLGFSPVYLGYYLFGSLWAGVWYFLSAWHLFVPVGIILGTVSAILVLESSYESPVPSQEVELFNLVRKVEWGAIAFAIFWLLIIRSKGMSVFWIFFLFFSLFGAMFLISELEIRLQGLADKERKEVIEKVKDE